MSATVAREPARRRLELPAGVRGVISGRLWDVTTFQYLSYATQYQNAADFYVMHAILP